MTRIETLNEWFFPVNFYIENGKVVPAPAAAVQRRDDLRDGWLKDHPDLQEEKPMVSMGPVIKDGKPGYSVRTEIVYKPKSG